MRPPSAIGSRCHRKITSSKSQSRRSPSMENRHSSCDNKVRVTNGHRTQLGKTCCWRKSGSCGSMWKEAKVESASS